MTSKEFQQSVSYDQFLAYVNNYEVLRNYKDHKFSSREVNGDTGTIQGTLTAKNGATSPVEYKFVKENGEWKILSIDLSGTTGTNPNSTSGNMQTFSDSSLGYSIQYPKDWTMERKDSVTVLFSGPKEKNMDNVTINIQNLKSSSNGGKYKDVNDVVKDLKNQLRGMDRNVTFSDITDATFKRTDGMDLPAKSFAAKLNHQGEKFVLAQVVVPHGDGLVFHSLGYTVPTDKFDQDFYKSILENWVINK